MRILSERASGPDRQSLMTSVEVRPVAGALGATVTGMDLNKVTEDGELDDVRKALADP